MIFFLKPGHEIGGIGFGAIIQIMTIFQYPDLKAYL